MGHIGIAPPFIWWEEQKVSVHRTSSQSANIKGRFFLVGCPRSGTTLLQCILGAHSDVATFPETRFFNHHIGRFESRVCGLNAQSTKEKFFDILRQVRITAGLSTRHGANELFNFLHDIKRDDLIALYPKESRFLWPQLRGCIKVLDQLAFEEQKHYWLEKTPVHLGYLDIIEKLVPDARVVHIIRSGPETVASIYDAAARYPKSWSGWYRNIDNCIRQWNFSLSTTIKYAGKHNHCVVLYEELVERPEIIVPVLCRFFGIDYEPVMVDSHSKVAEKITLEREGWKSNIAGTIRQADTLKFQCLFTDNERKYILSKIKTFDRAPFSLLQPN